MSYYGSGNPQGGYGYGREEDGCGREQSGGYGYGREQPGGYGREQPGGYGREQPGGYGREQPGGYGREQPGGYGREQPGGYGREQSGGYGHEESGYGRESGGYGHGRESGGYAGGHGSSGYEGHGHGGGHPQQESYGSEGSGYGEYGREERGGYGRGDHHQNRNDQDQDSMMNRPGGGGGASARLQGPVMKIYCEANPDYYVTVSQDGVVLVPGNESNEQQQFVKDCKWGSRVQDEAGFPAFAIVHKASGMALKHGNDAYDKVTLQPYDPETLDESVLWTQSDDVGNGYQCFRPVGNIHLNMDAHHGDTKLRSGAEIILFKWKKQENQKWKMVPISSSDGARSYDGGSGPPAYERY